jgi:uncharacterized repeat protein (TIGR01451 family)
LLQNGDFQTPEVTTGSLWNIFPSGTTGLDWVVSWFGGSTTFGASDRPEIANIELQEHGLSGWASESNTAGDQWTELDADWFGPTVNVNGEPGAVMISQDIPTVENETYEVSFDFSPRPNTVSAQNKVEVLADGVIVGTVGPLAGSSNTVWTRHIFEFEALDSLTTIAFRDAGTPNDSLGTFIDNASVMCVPPPTTATINFTKIVCTDESELPNYGSGGPNMTTATAANWVSTHDSCDFASGWQFESVSAEDDNSNPGDNDGLTGAPWALSAATDINGTVSVTVDPADRLWLREVPQSGYIPFTGVGGSNVSAEFYCESDVLNYDNYDFIDDVIAGGTYYCVAWNSPVLGAPTLTIVKETDGDDDSFSFEVFEGESLMDTLSFSTSEGVGTSETITLPEGTYTLWEIEQLDWILSDVQCDYNGGAYGFEGSPNGHQIVVHNGDEVVCTFENVETEPECPQGTFFDNEINQCVQGEGSFADLELTKEVDDTTPDVGQNITYTITLTNNGPHVDGDILVLENLPLAGLSYVSHSGDGSFNSSTGEWEILSLGVDASVSLSITFVVLSGEEGQTIENFVSIEASQASDNNSENDSDSVLVTVNGSGVPQCSDGIDNDGDGTIDHGFDPGCNTPEDDNEDDSEDVGPTGGGGGGGPLNIGFVNGGSVLGASTEGQVLGESCGLFMDQHLRRGSSRNNAEQVMKLQQFLNKYGFGAFSPTGFFGPLTEGAVKAFQNQYASSILAPWNLPAPTGLVYLTSLRQINLLECPDLLLDVPALVPWSQNPNAQ